ncbi:hypothetical protein ACI78V_09555 [Geodermatophilus sp. SYSU D00742]
MTLPWWQTAIISTADPPPEGSRSPRRLLPAGRSSVRLAGPATGVLGPSAGTPAPEPALEVTAV